MKALILAAGEGSRLRPLTLEKPKPMVAVGGEPVLEHIIDWLAAHGVSDIAINLHYRPAAITAYFGSGRPWGVRITYSEENPILGSAGAIRKLSWYFQETALVVYGDVLTNTDLQRLLRFHESKRALGPCLTMLLYHVANPTACGIVELDPDNRVRRLLEKPRPDQVFSDLANAGILLIEPALIAEISPEVPYDFGADLIPSLLERGVPVWGLPLDGHEYLIDIGTPAAYARACLEWPSVRKSSELVC